MSVFHPPSVLPRSRELRWSAASVCSLAASVAPSVFSGSHSLYPLFQFKVGSFLTHVHLPCYTQLHTHTQPFLLPLFFLSFSF